MAPAQVEACLSELRQAALRGYSVTAMPVDAKAKYFTVQASEAYARGEPILRMTGVDGQHASAGFALP